MPSIECEQEFEVLESIYKEIVVVPETSDGGSLVSILVYPKSAGDMERRYVTLKLEFHLQSTYPTSLPIVQFRNPRGLSEEQLVDLENQVKKINNEFAGSPVIFQLIDMVQDYLTSNNRPTAECPICLMSFTEVDVFYTPSCFHHYHSHCLGLHLQSVLKKDAPEDRMPSSPIKMSCPVCRVELDPEIDIGKLLSSPPATEESFDMVAHVSTVNIGLGRDDLEAIFLKQKKQGGIISLAEDCNRLLRISSHDTNSQSMPVSSDSTNLVGERGNHHSTFQSQTNGRHHSFQPHANKTKGLHHYQHHKPFHCTSRGGSTLTQSNRAPYSHQQGQGRGRQEIRRSNHTVSESVKPHTSKQTRHSSSSSVVTSKDAETGGERTGTTTTSLNNHSPDPLLVNHKK